MTQPPIGIDPNLPAAVLITATAVIAVGAVIGLSCWEVRRLWRGRRRWHRGARRVGVTPGKLAQAAAGLLPDAVSHKVIENGGVDRLTALHNAIGAVRGGTVSISGVYGGSADPMPMMDLFDEQVALRMGQCNVRKWVGDIPPLVEDSADPLGVLDLTTHAVPITEALRPTRHFRRRVTAASRWCSSPEPAVIRGVGAQKASCPRNKTAGRSNKWEIRWALPGVRRVPASAPPVILLESPMPQPRTTLRGQASVFAEMRRRRSIPGMRGHCLPPRGWLGSWVDSLPHDGLPRSRLGTGRWSTGQ
jgi:hypothetical protein